MPLYSVVFFYCLSLICQTSSQDAVDTDRNYILCERKISPSLECSSTQIIIIKNAIYGRTDLAECPNNIDSNVPLFCNLTVTNRVASNCNYKQECIPDSTNIDGDPCVNIYKYLNVTYRCIEGICIWQPCSDSSKCDIGEGRGSCFCTSELTNNECKYEYTRRKTNRMISFKTANKTNDLVLLNLKKCVKEEIGFLKFKVNSSRDVYITMVGSSIEKQELTIEVVINTAVIYLRFDENEEYKTITKNIEVSCNTCSNLAVNWKDGIFKIETMLDDNLVRPIFTGIFKINDIRISSAVEADWILNFFEPDGPNYAKVKILPNGAPQTLICQVFQNCNNQLSGEIVPVLFGKASSKCSKEPKIKTMCNDTDNGAELNYLCLNQVQRTNEGCKDIIRISACKGENSNCEHCKYHNIEMDIKTVCVNKTERLLVFPDRRCENLHDLLTIWHEIHDEQFESSTKLSTVFFTTSSSSPSTTEPHVSFSTTENILTESDMNNQETQKSEIIGLAVGISASVIVIIVIACVLIFLRKKKRLPKKESTQTSTNGQDYIGHQNVAVPWPGDSREYTDMKVRRESHKYGELKSVSEATGDSCYDVIDANEDQWKKKIFSVEQGIFQNDSSSIPCQEYAMLDPNEKWNTESNTTSYHDKAFDDYTVLEAEEGKNNHPVHPPSDQFNKNITKNNETKTEVKSAENATPDNYVVLDPKLTGFNRMNDIGNDKSLEKRALSNPNIRKINHKTTHPLKEDTKFYELAKPLEDDGKENTCHKYDGDYGLCQDSDYNKPNAGYPTYSEEHVYNHTVDDVYDTTSHNKKSTVPDNTYDYFSGDKTDDDYNIPMKM